MWPILGGFKNRNVTAVKLLIDSGHALWCDDVKPFTDILL